MTDRRELLDDIEAHGLMEAVYRRLQDLEDFDDLDAKGGGRYLVLALRGYQVRHHFDEEHPEQVERGADMAPPEERDREAWLFGYRFVDSKGGAA